MRGEGINIVKAEALEPVAREDSLQTKPKEVEHLAIQVD